MRIIQNETQALCIDIQQRLFSKIWQNELLESRCILLIKGLQVLDIPILVTEQYPKGLGATIPSIHALFADLSVLEKACFSCVDDSTILKSLLSSQRPFVLLFGIEAHVCVLQSCIDLREQGMQAVVIVDCIGSRTEQDKSVAIERMRQEGAILSTSESILFELCRTSERSQFKLISQLVK